MIGLTIATISALVEEIVWRGYYHVQLRKSYSIHHTATIGACIWSVWHLPIAIFYKGYIDGVQGFKITNPPVERATQFVFYINFWE